MCGIRKSSLSAAGEAREIAVYMLGETRLQVGDQSISDDSNRSLKLWSVLCYLIIHRDRAVTQSELIETFWSEEDTSSPLSALKMLILRTRTLLKPLVGQDKDSILSRRGAYQWNPAIICQVDAERFGQLCLQASCPDTAPHRRMALYQAAMELYQGDFLPKQSNQQWVIPLSFHYHDQYINAVTAYAALLEEAGQFEQMGELSMRANERTPLDEQLYTLVIRALMLQKKNAAALHYYEKATKLLYQNLGVCPSEELQELYTTIIAGENPCQEDLGMILKTAERANPSNGAFFCEYAFFEGMYQLESRRAARSGSCLHVAMMTLSPPDNREIPPQAFHAVMEQLQETIVQSLRRSDVVSRYSRAQFIMMLPSANLEDSTMVMERIVSAFYHRSRKSAFKLSYKLQPLAIT